MLITHDLGVIAEMADYVVVMYAGRVVEKGTAKEVFLTPAHPYTIGSHGGPSPSSTGRWTGCFRSPAPCPTRSTCPTTASSGTGATKRCELCNGAYPGEIAADGDPQGVLLAA